MTKQLHFFADDALKGFHSNPSEPWQKKYSCNVSRQLQPNFRNEDDENFVGFLNFNFELQSSFFHKKAAILQDLQNLP